MTPSETIQPTVAPYGEWVSPIRARDLTASSHPVSGGAFVGDDVWWAEGRPDEGGRTAIRRAGPDGEPVDVLPAPFNARTRVHEYGGGAWCVAEHPGTGPRLIFAEFTDQRLYRLDPGSEHPIPLTPPGLGMRFADLTVAGNLIWCVRETHAGGDLRRDICTVPVDGAAADSPDMITSIVSGSRFFAYPKISPDGARLAWICWEHPQMPWDGTELRVADLDAVADTTTTLMGGATESVLQPEWLDASSLAAVSDRSGWWNLYAVDAAGGPPRSLLEDEAEYGGPLWQLGTTWYSPLEDGTLLTVRTRGTSRLGVLNPDTGERTGIGTDLDAIAIADVRGGKALITGGSSRRASGLREVDLRSGDIREIRLGVDHLPPADYLPDCRSMTFTGERDVHAFVYSPFNRNYTAPDGELPPFVAFVHGGPTSQTVPKASTLIAYFTSRGIGVIDVNYGGSSGYGREYRDRLKGQWGVVDVDDVVTAVRGLADQGIADPDRLAIEGGSAGGWTVLASLTGSDAFACGASYFGVAELIQFAKETHDFESRYLDGLIGPLPEAEELYVERAPLTHADKLTCPVLLLQGLDDPIVPPSQAERFRDALAAKHIPYAYLAFEGESHGFRRAETIIAAREAELSFYGQCLGFTPPDVPRLELVR